LAERIGGQQPVSRAPPTKVDLKELVPSPGSGYVPFSHSI